MDLFRLAASIEAEERRSFANNASTSSAAAAALPSEEEDGSDEEVMILVSLCSVGSKLLPTVIKVYIDIADHGCTLYLVRMA